MSTHEITERLMQGYLRGDLNDEQVVEFECHLAACDACCRAFELQLNKSVAVSAFVNRYREVGRAVFAERTANSLTITARRALGSLKTVPDLVRQRLTSLLDGLEGGGLQPLLVPVRGASSDPKEKAALALEHGQDVHFTRKTDKGAIGIKAELDDEAIVVSFEEDLGKRWRVLNVDDAETSESIVSIESDERGNFRIPASLFDRDIVLTWTAKASPKSH